METIGQQLKAARDRKGVTASQAALATHLKVQHIEALERDDYSRLTVPTYAKGFLRIYADYLNLDPAPLMREYTLHHTPPTAARPGAESISTQLPAAGRSFKLPQFSLPALPTLSPDLARRLTFVTGALVVVLLLLLALRHGCHRTAPTTPIAVAPPVPVATNRPPRTSGKPAPWVIVNEPPPPYYQRPVAPTP